MKFYLLLLIAALITSLGLNGYFLLNQLPQKDNLLPEDSTASIKPSSPSTKTLSQGSSVSIKPSSLPQTSNYPKPTLASSKQLIVLKDVTLKNIRGNVDNFGIEIIGAFTSLKDCQYALVEFLTYDKSGNRVGTAYDILSELKASEVWNFEARGYGEARTYKLESAECNNYR